MCSQLLSLEIGDRSLSTQRQKISAAPMGDRSQRCQAYSCTQWWTPLAWRAHSHHFPTSSKSYQICDLWLAARAALFRWWWLQTLTPISLEAIAQHSSSRFVWNLRGPHPVRGHHKTEVLDTLLTSWKGAKRSWPTWKNEIDKINTTIKLTQKKKQCSSIGRHLHLDSFFRGQEFRFGALTNRRINTELKTCNVDRSKLATSCTASTEEWISRSLEPIGWGGAVAVTVADLWLWSMQFTSTAPSHWMGFCWSKFCIRILRLMRFYYYDITWHLKHGSLST